MSVPRYSRRHFLSASVATLAGITLAGCASDRSQAVRRASTLIDTHTHFYDPSRPQGVPWPRRDIKQLYRTVLPTDYRALPVPRPVTGTIVVEASPWVEDNQWILDLATRDSFIVGLIGNLPVGTKEFAAHLNRFTRNKRFRGIRLRDRKLDGLLDTPAFVSDLKLLPFHDLSLDLVGGMEILSFADRLADLVPDLRIIIDHLAGVKVDGKAPSPEWLGQMQTIARRPHIYCKLSGLVEGTGRSDGSAPHDLEFYRPVLDAMWTTFGPDRLMYASNWPVSELFAPLATVQGIVTNYVRPHGSAAEARIFAGTSKVAYATE
jgi:L-fuconolactonase